MQTPLEQQYRLIFGDVLEQVAAAPDWRALSKAEKVRRVMVIHRYRWQLSQPSGPFLTSTLVEGAIEALDQPD
jgi:hypothetical protein